MITSRPVVLLAGCTAAAALLLTGCGGSSKASSGTGTKAPSSGANRSSFNSGQLDTIRQCLKAAGLSISVPSGRPSNLPSGIPSNLPSGIPSNLPSGIPSNLPSGFPTGAPGAGGNGVFSDPKVQQALTACGISVPTAAARQ